jgi:hypothetical protein
MTDQTPSPVAPLDAEQVRGLCGELLDDTVAKIIESGATLAELETALAWAKGQDDVMGEAEEPLSGAAAVVFDLLASEDDLFEER